MGLGANTDGLRSLSAALRQAIPDADVELRNRVKDAGATIGHQAERNADWSHKIPRTIRWTARGLTVTVTAGYKSVPIAKWFENGRTTRSAVWRHPVFPSSKWALQGIATARRHWHWATMRDPKRPYLRPALQETKEQVTEDILTGLVDVIQSAIDEAGGV